MLLFSILFYHALFDFVIVFCLFSHIYSYHSFAHSLSIALVVARYEFASNFKGTCLQTAELSLWLQAGVRASVCAGVACWAIEQVKTWGNLKFSCKSNVVVVRAIRVEQFHRHCFPSSFASQNVENVVVRARTRQEEKHARYSFLFCMFAYSKEMRIIRRCFMRVWLIDALITRINYVIACHFVIKRHKVLVFLEK